MNMVPYRRDNGMFNLLDAMERSFFNDSIGGFAQFRTDISEKDDKYMLEAELPGFEAKDINVNVDGDTLTISAEHSSSNDKKDEAGNYIRRERRYGSFSRSFDISGIEADGISADYSNGVLAIELPKASQKKPETRQIAVNSKAKNPGMEQGEQMGAGTKEQSQGQGTKPVNKPAQSIADQQAEYTGPAKEQAEQVQQNSQPDEYAGGSESDYPNPKQ